MVTIWPKEKSGPRIVSPTQKKTNQPPIPFGPGPRDGNGEDPAAASEASAICKGGGTETGEGEGLGVKTVLNGAHSSIPSFQASVIGAMLPLSSIDRICSTVYGPSCLLF